MTDPGLVTVLDFILNRSDNRTIEVIAEAVVRRRRDLSMYSALGASVDPQHMAKEISNGLKTGIDTTMEGLKELVRETTVRIIRENAPDLSEGQIEELCRTWVDGNESGAESMPQDMLLSMIEQFVSFSRGTMGEAVDKSLREEMGSWPERYWRTFPPVIRSIVTDFLKDRITEKEYNSKIKIALKL
ncbi:MAG: hypothetical protein LBG91_01565 [Treponema sp.]|jgi:hypothetical protein|nr:hypothetical protein [Treponema sp.]